MFINLQIFEKLIGGILCVHPYDNLLSLKLIYDIL